MSEAIELIIVKSKTKRQQLVPHAYNQPQVVDASHLLVICIQRDINLNDIETATKIANIHEFISKELQKKKRPDVQAFFSESKGYFFRIPVEFELLLNPTE